MCLVSGLCPFGDQDVVLLLYPPFFFSFLCSILETRLQFSGDRSLYETVAPLLDIMGKVGALHYS